MSLLISLAFMLVMQDKTPAETAAMKFVHAIYVADKDTINEYIKDNCVPWTSESIDNIVGYSLAHKAALVKIDSKYVGPDIEINVVISRNGKLNTASYIFHIEKFKWVGNKVYSIEFEEDETHQNKSALQI